MRFGYVVLALTTSLSLISKVQALEVTLRPSLELGYIDTPQRASTLLNPGGQLLSPSYQSATGALSLRGQLKQGNWRGVGHTWLQANHDLHASREKASSDHSYLQTPEAWLEYSLNETTSMAAGLNIARWGTGYFWNPANPVNDPDANNTSRAQPYRRIGDGFARLETSFGRDSAGLYATYFRQRDTLLSPTQDREWALYGRYQHVADSGDVSAFLSVRHNEQFAGLASSMTATDQSELHAELGLRSRRRTPRIETTQLAIPQTLLTWYNWQTKANNRWTPGLLFGGQYTTDNRVNFIAEYIYNGNGYTSAEYSRLRRSAGYSNALLTTPLREAGRGFLLESNRLVSRLRQHYLFFRTASEEVWRNTDLHYYLRLGLADTSQIHGIFLRHAFTQRLSAQLSTEIYTGPRHSETRLIPVKYQLQAILSYDFDALTLEKNHAN